MKIRTQLVLGFLVLAVVPLAAIVVYSYYSSADAIRTAMQADAEALTGQMDQRVDEMRQELGRRLARLSQVPMVDSGSGGSVDPRFSRDFLRQFGDKAQMLEQVEIVPVPPAASGHTAIPAPAAPKKYVINVDEIVKAARKAREAAIQQRLKQATTNITPGENVEATPEISAPPEDPDPVDDTAPEPPAADGTTGAKEAPAAPPIPSASELAAAGRAQEQASKELEAHLSKILSDKQLAEADPIQAPELRRQIVELKQEADSLESQRQLQEATRRAIEEAVKRSHGESIEVPVFRKGTKVGTAWAKFSTPEVLKRLLDTTKRGGDEIPFAVDRDRKLYTANDTDRNTVASFGPSVEQPGRHVFDDWIVVTSRDTSTGFLFGIAKPVGRSLSALRATSARNFGYGLALVGLALIGIIPLSNHFTRDIAAVTAGAQQIAHGDLETRVPVRSANEVGQLATAFNQMAQDLQLQRQQLVREEGLRKEQELEQRLLKVEYDRKTDELEEARRFQLSLLPKELPQSDRIRLAVYMQTATEVGGDYYDFLSGSSDSLTTVIGDATGHGARAGTMVTVIKSLFATYDPATAPSQFLSVANDAIRRMDLGRMSMALLMARLHGDELTVANAAMPPVLHYSAASGSVTELAVEGMPLGTLATSYHERSVRVQKGDALLLMSDGFPELQGLDGEPLGYGRALSEFASVAQSNPEEVVARLSAAAAEWNGGSAPNDDITFVVLKIS